MGQPFNALLVTHTYMYVLLFSEDQALKGNVTAAKCLKEWKQITDMKLIKQQNKKARGADKKTT